VSTTDTFTSVAASVTTYADVLTSPAREVIAEMIASRGGIGLLVVGGLGVIVLAFDAARVVARLIGRTGGPATASRSRVSRSAQARALAVAGAAPTEILQRTGLSRDALALVTTGAAPEASAPAEAPAAEAAPVVRTEPGASSFEELQQAAIQTLANRTARTAGAAAPATVNLRRGRRPAVGVAA